MKASDIISVIAMVAATLGVFMSAWLSHRSATNVFHLEKDEQHILEIMEHLEKLDLSVNLLFNLIAQEVDVATKDDFDRKLEEFRENHVEIYNSIPALSSIRQMIVSSMDKLATETPFLSILESHNTEVYSHFLSLWVTLMEEETSDVIKTDSIVISLIANNAQWRPVYELDKKTMLNAYKDIRKNWSLR